MFNMQYERQATVFLSLLWLLAALLAVAAFVVSVPAGGDAVRRAAPALPHKALPAEAESVESAARSSMLHESRVAIAKHERD